MRAARLLVHLPWLVAITLALLLLGLGVLVHGPYSRASERAAALDALGAMLPGRVLAIELLARSGNGEGLHALAGARDPERGLRETLIIDPDGTILASSTPDLAGTGIGELGAPLREILSSRLGERFPPVFLAAPDNDDAIALASVLLPAPDGAAAGAQGLLYQRWDPEAISRSGGGMGSALAFALAAVALVFTVALPLQYFVHTHVTRRLQRLSDDVLQFGSGTREGLFLDSGADRIGQISALLREITRAVAGREVVAQRLDLAIESANAGVWDWDIADGLIETNAQYHIMLGDEPPAAPLPAPHVIDRVHPDDGERVQAALRRLLKGTDSLYDIEFRMRGNRGNYTWLRSTGRVVARDAAGLAVRMLGQHVDITGQKATEAHERDLATIVENALDEIYVAAAPDLRLRTANRAARENLGYTRDALLAMSLPELVPAAEREGLEERVAALLSGGEEHVWTAYSHRRSDGSAYDVEAILQLLSYGGEPAIVAIVRDISDHRRQQQALEASEEQFRTFIQHSGDMVFIVDTDGTLLDVNDTACRALGYTRGALFARGAGEVDAGLDADRLPRFLASLALDRPMLFEREFRRSDGTTLPVEARVARYDFSGLRRVLVMARDITARRQSEARERIQAERFRKMFEGGAHSIAVFDRDLRFVMINQVGARDIGQTPDSLIGRRLDEVLPDFYPIARVRIAAALDERKVREFEDEIDVGGARRWFASIVQPLEDDAGHLNWVHVVSYDTTVRRRSVETLRAQSERFRALVESTSAILWEGNPETFQFTYVNQEAEKVLDYPVEDWTENPRFWAEHVHPADREQTIKNCKEAVERCEEHTLEYRMVAAGGRTVWLRDKVSVLSHDGRPSKLVGVMIDITQEKEEEERFRAAFESIPIGNIIIDDRGIIQLANPAAEQTFGYPADEMVGRNVSMLMPSPYRDEHDRYVQNFLDTGVTTIIGGSREAVGLRKSGEEFPLRLAVGEMRRGNSRTFVGSVVDLTAVKNLENQLMRSQKMEAVGQLAGGIAHDFNNLLHVIIGFVELAREGLPADAPVQVELEQIALAGERAAALTRQLLAFSRRQVLQPVILDLNEVVARTTAMLQRVIGEHIKLEVLANPHLARVHADAGMLEQVLMNLCVNARDAMPNGGHLQIETENVVISESYCLDHLWARPGRYVLISVTDTGCGMPREMQDHIFEPFFTTKPAQQGTGLGLSTVYGIVKQHNGIINVYSELDTGTTFKIYLPHSERMAEHVGTKIAGEVPLGVETVLVVEDDQSVRRLTRVMLESAGYAVIEAENGRKALHCFRENVDDIHLVLLDVVMPDMGGREAYDEMRKIAPELKALFASGYSENAIHTNFVLHTGLALLKKPYARDELLRAVRRLLDADDSGENASGPRA